MFTQMPFRTLYNAHSRVAEHRVRLCIAFWEILNSNGRMGTLDKLQGFFQTEVSIHPLAAIDQLVEFIRAEVVCTSKSTHSLTKGMPSSILGIHQHGGKPLSALTSRFRG